MAHPLDEWLSSDSLIASHVTEESRRTLAAYQAQPNLVREHVGIEEEVLSGGYGHRQIHELIQNAADAILENGQRGRVHLLLTREALYCANEGAPIDEEGVNAILNSHMSRKRGTQIGQFGIGFKSVLAISRSPQFLGRTGCFGFDAESSFRRISAVLPSISRAPVLRLARPLEAADVEGDTHLKRLAEWATTVIRLPRDLARTDWISEDFDGFPPEFLIFSPHVRLLTLEDAVTGRTRQIETSTRGRSVLITESGDRTLWTVFKREVQVRDLGEEAYFDADRKTRERASLPLLWAVPHSARRTRGQFWAFFPTGTETTLTGILNAPWKTNADRQNLLAGAFNRSLIKETVGLVAESLAGLYRQEDPGFLLDVLPARAADAAGWADQALIEGLEPALARIPCLPSTSGELRIPAELRMRPAAALTPGITQLLEHPDTSPHPDWVHATIEKRERRAKAARLGVTEADVDGWLEALATPLTAEASISSIFAAGWIHKELRASETEILRKARIILTASGALAAAGHPGLFIPLAGERGDSPEAVHPMLAQRESVRAALRLLRVSEHSGKAQLEAILSGYGVDWVKIWELLRTLPVGEALDLVTKHSARNPVHVRSRAGEFKPVERVLLPGPIVQEDDDSDAGVCVDSQFHDADLALIHALGGTAAPEAGRDASGSAWFPEFLRLARTLYLAELKGANPQVGYIEFRQSTSVGPLDPLRDLSAEGARRMTELLLPFLSSEKPWVMGHRSRPGAYPSKPFAPPVAWMLRQHGRLSTTAGTTAVSESVGPSLAAWSGILAVADVPERAAESLKLPQSLSDLGEARWKAALGRIQQIDDDVLVGRFYTEAARLIPPPDAIWCRAGDEAVLKPPAAVHLAVDDESAEAHRQSRIPSVRVLDRDSLQTLSERWGMQKPAGAVRVVPSASETPLADVLPGLRRYLPPSLWDNVMQPCEQIWFESATGEVPAVPLRAARVGEQFCYLDSMDLPELLKRTVEELGLTLTPAQSAEALGYAVRDTRVRLAGRVSAAPGLPEKLKILVGADRLLQGLPPGVQELLARRGEITPDDIAGAALAVHGVEVLRRHADALQGAGLEPPSRWNGSPRAQEFVDELGFPPEFAGFQSTRRDPTLDVDGPIDLKPLHDFQEAIGLNIKAFLSHPEPERGLVSLPTGSGKTRVVVQAFAEAMRDGTFSGSVVWIAQSDELCEQAVQSWAEVWRVFGSPDRLRISRLWGGTNNRVVEAGEPHVVVATFQSLVSRLRNPAYGWIRQAGCVIIDEAHGSIAPSYTEILEQFGITARTTERPLIGLTATPFRSAADPGETQWLVNRYGGRRFDHGVLDGDDPYPVLQQRGILAQVDQQVLEGASLTLTPSELADLNQYKRLPASAELRLGEIAPRNARIVQSIKELPEDWPVLLFATSVEQAHLMAALLSLEGISAKAISGETEAGSRRHYIREFRRGNIRVLSNYNVLSTGFDAPALRALYIARPVFSPVLYQQMLGRGLRGPLNGGKERCLVVNVQDNIAQFGEQLAFRHFEYLWQNSKGDAI